jgi:protein involved in polysaccharide export with SLBB domain
MFSAVRRTVSGSGWVRGLTAFAGAALLLLAPTGCWTRLTTPKESFLYEIGGTAPIILAPQYQEELLKIEAKLGPQQYRMVVGTRITIEVYGHGVKEAVNIRPDGMIDLPLIGDVMAEGKSIPELKKEIAGLYKPFFQQEPQVILNTDRDSDLGGPGVRAGDVSVINPRGALGFGISGGGVVNITGDERLSQILAQVAGLSTEAEWRQIAVIRQRRDHKESVIILCDMERVIKYGDLRQDILMRNGDVVFIPIERHTVIQEIWATFSLVAQITGNANAVTDYVERIERY